MGKLIFYFDNKMSHVIDDISRSAAESAVEELRAGHNVTVYDDKTIFYANADHVIAAVGSFDSDDLDDLKDFDDDDDEQHINY